MKKIIRIMLVILTGTAVSLFATKNKRFLWKGEIMDTKKVCDKWGDFPMDLEKFKLATNDRSIRAKMACSFLKKQDRFIGKNRTEMWEILGKHDGFYFSEMYPAYIINNSEKNKNVDIWQILFLMDINRNISEVVVHKNCCNHELRPYVDF